MLLVVGSGTMLQARRSRVRIPRLVLSKVPNRVGVSPSHLTETDPVSETFSLAFRISDDGQSPETQYF
jgi:hypothetical protein